ncbi:hypothetical protein BFS06_12200 [Clostridium perfringens]|uniref:Putative endonuclease n=2 Tax=Clostridium perfringens TaxID=1502 RepID=A0A140GR07_CLOPF|nr:HNH endonuclease [Clostridium perfringens]AMN30966.1 putative endonuclease [Clostridium perfringens]TBX14962.1 hypothetical protein BFS06_12200 [Clostridium perfringens]
MLREMVVIKNRYEIKDDVTIIYVDRPDGETLEVLIDTKDLSKAMSFKNSWGATKSKNRWLIKGTWRENGVKKNISLNRYLFDACDNSCIRFINGNTLDHRRCNLTNSEAVQIVKGNEYEIKGDRAFLKLNRRDGSKLITQIDLEDLDRVTSKGTWFAEWHKDFNNYFVQNVSYYYEDGKKHRKKISLHTFLMNTKPSEPIRHCDGDTLNNCKANLKVYNRTMMNDYEQISDDTIAIILRDSNGNEKARTLIDKEDLEKVINNGHTWCYFRCKGEPYAVLNLKSKRVYLHRFIMNTPKDMVTDHINHDTLDNRKRNLRNATISENMQNRKSARRDSKSGIRGISWDSGNHDWIVSFNGKYYGRFKDIDKAKDLAEEKLREVFPYLKKIKNI